MFARMTAVMGCLVLFVSGCATTQQKQLNLSEENTSYKNVRIGVVMTQLPKVEMQYPGAGCLLCLAAASVTNSSLSKYTESLPREEVLGIKNDVAGKLRAKGADVIVIDEDLTLKSLPDWTSKGEGVAPKNFSSIQQKYKLDKLLVIDISVLGISRNYSGYIPTSDPKGLLIGKGYIVNLSSNTYDWYQPIEQSKSSEGNWDEPPSYPGLTNAYFQAIELGKDEILRPFVN